MAQPDLVPLSDLVFTATHSVHHGLLQLSERLGQNLTDLQRREYLLQYIAQARTLLGRLLALSRWSAARMPEVQRASDALAELDRRQLGMRKMADELFFLHEALPAACAPPYDVRAAVDVLGSGRYSQLPRTIEAFFGGAKARQQRQSFLEAFPEVRPEDVPLLTFNPSDWAEPFRPAER